MWKSAPLLFFIVSSLFQTVNAFCQRMEKDTAVVNKGRAGLVLAGATGAYTVALISLDQLWYKEQDKTSFHFFNDNAEWNQVDKFGHFYSAYQISRIGNAMFRWTGEPPKKAAIYGSIMSQAMMVPIEILDGYSKEYGFSWGDLVANMSGAGLFLAQQLVWKEQRIKPKFSFHTTGYAAMRPEVLGKSLNQQLLKDYNGHTYWFSLDIHAFLPEASTFPKWLNLAIGYGADGMVYSRENENNAHRHTSHRQFYLGPDLDLSHIKTNKKMVKALLFIADMIKIPAPTLEYTAGKGFDFHYLYF